ncbi:hypothetical protein [Maricaulis sp. W15]|uniref:hypothetical protein n=1 Tax=Maricaulis sp. W15 TaxID=1772333 RepID=UPI0013014FB4|nr:hypothetical protein [Maricaulis sp. W15]
MGDRRRFGCRRLGMLLAREGLAVRRFTGKRRPMVVPSRFTQRRSLGFRSDAPSDERRLGTLSVVNDCIREAPAITGDTSSREPTSRKAGPLPWPSGVGLRPEAERPATVQDRSALVGQRPDQRFRSTRETAHAMMEIF